MLAFVEASMAASEQIVRESYAEYMNMLALVQSVDEFSRPTKGKENICKAYAGHTLVQISVFVVPSSQRTYEGEQNICIVYAGHTFISVSDA